MTVLKEGQYAGDVIRYEEDSCYSREAVTIAAGADLSIGSVLGHVTASGKYVLHAPGAGDGSETVAGILISPAYAATEDHECAGLMRHARVNRHALIFDGTIDDETKRDAAVAGLRALGIIAD